MHKSGKGQGPLGKGVRPGGRTVVGFHGLVESKPLGDSGAPNGGSFSPHSSR